MWMIVLVSSCLLALSYGVMTHYISRSLQIREAYKQNATVDARFSVSLGMLMPLYCFLNQGYPIDPKNLPRRIVFLGTAMAGVMISCSYSACLMSFLTVKLDKLPFTDMKSLLKNSNHRVLTVRGSFYEDVFKVCPIAYS